MKKIILTLSFFTAFSAMVFAQKKDARFEGLESMVNQILKEWNVPGVSISVVEKNKVLFTGGFGYKDFENKKPVTENTLFAIGSCTKAFTASLLSSEIKDGKIDMDAPVNSYFPELRFYSNELTANVTVRDMLCHRTGIPRHDFSWYSGAATSRDSLVRLIRFLEPSAPIRQSFQYNNLMYVAVANLLEKMNKKSWEEQIQEKLFIPLGMANSTTGLIPANGDFSYGYVYKNGQTIKLDFLTNDMKGIAPAGGITSSAKDMANWLLMWTNQGKSDGREIISSDFYKQAISSQMVANSNLPSKILPDYYFFNYGLGWYTANYRGHYGVAHGGNINGFSTFISFLPSDSIGVYVSANQNNSQVPRILMSIILDKMIGATFRDWNTILKATATNNTVTQVKNEEVAKHSHPLQDFEGIYKNDAYGTITIKAENDVLTGTFNRWKMKIKHLHHNYFKFTADNKAVDESNTLDGEFSVTPAGGIGSLKIAFEDNVKDIEFKKQIVTQLSKAELSKYAGDYEFSGMIAKIYLTESGILKAIVPGQPEYELIYDKQDAFTLKNVKGVSIQFERDDKGNIPAATFMQPNGSFKVKRITAAKSEPTGGIKKDENQSAINKNDFLKYAGDYNMSGQTVKIFLKENVLMALLPGQPEYALVHVKENEFNVKGVKGFSVKFNLGDNGNIGGFTLTQPNGSVAAIKK
jgi:CubicO group peptidase (beta-lactamase class C family)